MWVAILVILGLWVGGIYLAAKLVFEIEKNDEASKIASDRSSSQQKEDFLK